MAEVTEEAILEALKAVIEPERGKISSPSAWLPASGVKDGNVGFAIEVDPREGRGHGTPAQGG